LLTISERKEFTAEDAEDAEKPTKKTKHSPLKKGKRRNVKVNIYKRLYI
jgi:hypothetical protein